VSKWVVVALLLVQAHFAASYLVPLDAQSQREFGGLLRWLWPWSDGDGGPLGRVTTSEGSPLPSLWIALAAATAFLVAAASAAGLWAPAGWWRPLTLGGATLLVCLMALYLGPTKLLPAAVAALTTYLILRQPALLAAS
jgi:hypothetical protein